jgi:hypothetical protein
MAAGTASGEYGALEVSGSANFAGILALDLLNGLILAAGDSFAIAGFTSSSGDFSGFSLNGVSCTADTTDVWTCGDVVVSEIFGTASLNLEVTSAPSVVPEPAAAALLGAGLALTGIVRRRRRSGGLDRHERHP